METWNKRLDTAMNVREAKNTKLAQQIGVSGATVSDWRKGVIKTIEGGNLLKVCNYLQIRAEWLIWGKLPSGLENEVDQIKSPTENFGRTKNEVPVLSWVQAGDLCQSFDVKDFNTAEDWRPCPVKHGDRTFVLEIRGDSMWPEYPEGTDIFVDPEIAPRHNDDVIIVNDDGQATFKRLKITNEGYFIEAINPDWPDRVKALPENSKICGVVIYSGKCRR